MKVLRFEYENNRFELHTMFMDDISSMKDNDIQRDMLFKSKNIVKAALGFEGYLKVESFSTYEETNSVYCSYTF
ncbi:MULTISPECIES: hypothetical protein [Bacillus]|uniref:Uncharacterized protein n=1 Tax=Bacillus altitudinis TaxID=293387 RepID=A0A653P9Q6_BACAB|nr:MULTISPECIES: hypothetical protein [Bacillus]KML17540.1 hypothetical protein VL09_08425 [Bacillus stratosphericus]KQL47777.1 hypothetical protein AN962_02905 [Bacillus sp. FJAT-21955]KML63919.1 hypothetical protein VL19_02850 [Bacillus stratosphericus]KMN30466.1 hypothetical protein ABW26_16460 [Bacillus stratosphericus]KMN71636.1 hypothetical protein VK97_13930 [Bacillus sp. LK10]